MMVGGKGNCGCRLPVMKCSGARNHILIICEPDSILAMLQSACFTYIAASRSRTLYTGVTSNLQKRMFQHKWKEYDGFSARYNCDRLVWFESHQDIRVAIAREKQLKNWRREKKIMLIEKMNPAWVDLSREWYEVEPADLKRAADRMLS